MQLSVLQLFVPLASTKKKLKPPSNDYLFRKAPDAFGPYLHTPRFLSMDLSQAIMAGAFDVEKSKAEFESVI